MASILRPEILSYESPKVDVTELTSKDIICLSTSDVGNEGGAGFDENWGN